MQSGKHCFGCLEPCGSVIIALFSCVLRAPFCARVCVCVSVCMLSPLILIGSPSTPTGQTLNVPCFLSPPSIFYGVLQFVDVQSALPVQCIVKCTMNYVIGYIKEYVIHIHC